MHTINRWRPVCPALSGAPPRLGVNVCSARAYPPDCVTVMHDLEHFSGRHPVKVAARL
jgi:hypothetical protein